MYILKGTNQKLKVQIKNKFDLWDYTVWAAISGTGWSGKLCELDINELAHCISLFHQQTTVLPKWWLRERDVGIWFVFYIIYAPCYVSSFQKGIWSVVGNIQEDNKLQFKWVGVCKVARYMLV
jgi:hypothetical protein